MKSDAQTPYPCRLFCRLARQAAVGLIVRRGPSTWVQLSLWHTDTDEIEYGQWFHGRLLEDRCDLSPDGSLFIYFASKYGRSQFDTWTAISRPPYFTALALWPLGDSWGGGGLFVDGKAVLLGHNPSAAPAHKEHEPPSWLKVSMYSGGLGEIMPLSSERLFRDGWTRLQTGVWPPDRKVLKLLEPEIFQKRHPDGKHVLLMKYLGYDSKRYGSPWTYEFSLKDTTRDQETLLEGATWADLDHRQRLVFTKNDGCLYADELRSAEFSPQLLANLNNQRPSDVSTPEWATTWEKRASQGEYSNDGQKD
jgi:hypothetical protein